MAKKDIPQGFTVAYIDGSWYPLEACRLYSARYPNGFIALNTISSVFGDMCFATQHSALEECQEQARMNEEMQQRYWDLLANTSNVYPERCTEYISYIEQVTGGTPIITKGYYRHCVFVDGDYCHHCKKITLCVSTSAFFIEDALADAAEQVYATWCQCKQMHIAYQELLTA